MSRGRKPNPKPQPIDVEVNHEAVAEDTAALDKMAKRLNEIDAHYSDGTPYDRETAIQKTIFYLNQSAEAMLSAGKQLILLKEHEPHGDFLYALERIGLAPRAAQKMMQATVKFSKPSNAPLAAHLGRTKLLELVAEDDEELEQLAKGGTLAGHTLDEFERMTKAELRAALRKDREERKQIAAANEKLLLDKDKKINELDAKLARRDALNPDELTEDQSQALEREGTKARAAWLGVEVVIREIMEREDAPEHLKEACSHEIIRGVQWLYEIALRHWLNMQAIGEEIFPEWLREAREADIAREGREQENEPQH